jgi:hypothetical protein
MSPSDAAGIFRCAINDTHWVAVNNGLTDLNIRSLLAYADGTGDTALYAATAGGVFRSTDNGETWIPRNVGLVGLYTTALAYMTSASGQAILFASAEGGGGSGIHVSTDAGAHWTFLAQSPAWVRSMVVMRNPMGGFFVFAATDGRIFRSSDNGTVWIAVNTGLPQDPYINVLAAYDTVIFSGLHDFADRALFYSLDAGAHWILGTVGLNPSCWGIQSFAVSGSNVFAGTGSCEPSVWRRPLSEMITGVKDRDAQDPSGFSLEQNYPNPFNPATVISFQLPVSSFVSLRVYNLLGQEVATLVSEERQPGSYEVFWDASNSPNGMYFYRLRVGSFSETRKMMLIR